jgi:hypothetical protein
VGDTGIHSVQNGILLRSDIHVLFDKYMIAINPDVRSTISLLVLVNTNGVQNDYKIVCFVKKPYLDGLSMFRNLDVPAKYQPSRALLKHHFRMAVLCNMKGRAGFPKWDEDMPEGYDHLAEIANSEQGKLRLEIILAGRLNSLIA